MGGLHTETQKTLSMTPYADIGHTFVISSLKLNKCVTKFYQKMEFGKSVLIVKRNGTESSHPWNISSDFSRNGTASHSQVISWSIRLANGPKIS